MNDPTRAYHRKRHVMSTKSHKGVPFNWSDPFLLDDQLNEEERMIRETAAAFAADRLAPRVEAAYLNETTDPEIFREMGAAGLRVASGGGSARSSVAPSGLTISDMLARWIISRAPEMSRK